VRAFPRAVGPALAGVLSVALALPAGAAHAAGPTPAPSVPGAPTAGQIAAAKATAAKAAARLDATTKQLKDVQAELARVSAAAELAVAKWQSAQAAAATAQTTLTAAQAAADAAAADVSDYRRRLNEYAVAAYIDGGPIAQLAALLNASDPADVLTRNATLQEIGVGQSRVVSQFVDASELAAATKATAAQASASAQQLLAEAGAARTAAASAVQLAQSLLAKVAGAKDQLAAVTSHDRRQVTTLVRQRAAALAAARAAAARLAARQLQALATVNGFPAATPRQGRQALAWAQTQLGVPYSWGGGDANGPTVGFAETDGPTDGQHTVGFDCSGLTLYAWAHAGYALGHWTGAQWVQGTAVPVDELRPGDLLFFATDVTDPTTIHHVGIYAGNEQMIDAPQTGSVVRYDPAFNDEFIGAIRP
jgi:cell wall-associated NlpC family hydrolase